MHLFWACSEGQWEGGRVGMYIRLSQAHGNLIMNFRRGGGGDLQSSPVHLNGCIMGRVS